MEFPLRAVPARGSLPPYNVKKIFLTGASAGIGLATARALVQGGNEVWGTSRDLSRLPQLANFHPLRLDMTSSSSIAEAWETGLKEAGFFDVLINNAGSGHFGPAETLPEETLRSQMQLLAFGPIELCQRALVSMRAERRGLIINLTSLASRLPVPFTAAYNASKAAMASFTMTMQLELGDSPIRIVDLQPGDISTDFNDAVLKDEAADPEYQKRMEQAWRVIARNMNAAPKPEVVATRIVRLLSETNPASRVTVGDTFEAVIAPMIFAVLPPSVRVWGLRRYYGI